MASLQKPISIEFLVINGFSVNMDTGSFDLLHEFESEKTLLRQYPDVDLDTPNSASPMLYANYLLHLPSVESSVVLWVMLPSQKALDNFNTWCRRCKVNPDYWVGSEPSGDWQSIEDHDFESQRVIQLAWNRIQKYEMSKI